MLETWKVVVISIFVILFILVSVSFVVCKLRRPKKSTPQQKEDRKSYDIGKVEEQKVNPHMEDQMEKYGQQFAIVTPVQTELSPPRHVNTGELPAIAMPEQRQLRVFSLSPLHECRTPASNNTDSIVSSLRTATPFRTYTPPPTQDVWRGPTPVWTQYPGRS